MKKFPKKLVKAVSNFISVKEAAEVLGISEANVRVKAHRGELPFYQLPRGIRFLEKELLEYLEEKQRWETYKKEKCGLRGFLEQVLNIEIK